MRIRHLITHRMMYGFAFIRSQCSPLEEKTDMTVARVGSILNCISICQKRVELLESTCMFLNNAMDFSREMETYHFWPILRQIWQTAVRGSKCLSKCHKSFGM